MIPELGHFSLILALFVAITLAALALAGAARSNERWIAFARPATQGLGLLVSISFASLTWAFYANDFSVQVVAQHSNSALPTVFRITAVWGGHEGSMLLWTLILALWMVAVTLFSRRLPDVLVARVLGVMALVCSGFLGFVLFTSNPFQRLVPAAVDGRDLNPLLQDIGMVIHPPMLYMGYVGFSVAFAFAVAALMGGRLDAAWARWSRPWTAVAWSFLTLGIAIGSGWAYYELGWGGWWFWDPVENASFMPWLAGTALLHSLAVTEKRGAFRAWTALLAIGAFSLSLLGTFLVRSGVLTSVHAFATDPRRGVFILVLLIVAIGGTLALFARRAPALRATGDFTPVSRESFLLANNALLVVAAGTVFLGTLYPLLLDALGAGKISVGPPYFESVFVPIMTPVLLLMAVGPVVRWKRGALRDLPAALLLPALLGFAAAVGVPLALGHWSPLVALGMLLAGWVAGGQVVALRERLSATPGSVGHALSRQPRGFYGMLLAHLGVAVFVTGVTLVKGYERDRDVKMEAGDETSLGDYRFTLEALTEVTGPNYQAIRGTMRVTREGREVAVLHPEKRVYRVQKMPMTEAAIDIGLTRDLYVSLGEPLGGGAWAVRVQIKPFIDWIWGGCLLMGLGGVLAATDRRYRVARQAAGAPLAPLAARAGD